MRRLLSASLLPLLTCLGAVLPEVCRAAWPPAPSDGLVFVTNGAGGLPTISASLSQVVAETGAPLQIETWCWSHGYGRYLIDHVDHDNHLAHGSLLAGRVWAYRQACLDRRICLMGHSSGCAVVLAAAEMLPPDSVDRIILLAPSVSRAYDLRPALCTACGGIDVFYSRRDRLILGLATRIVGTADRCCLPAAGVGGFRAVVACPEDVALYSRLRQQPWDFNVAWSGNHGGHYGSNKAGFLRAYVLPLLVDD